MASLVNSIKNLRKKQYQYYKARYYDTKTRQNHRKNTGNVSHKYRWKNLYLLDLIRLIPPTYMKGYMQCSRRIKGMQGSFTICKLTSVIYIINKIEVKIHMNISYINNKTLKISDSYSWLLKIQQTKNKRNLTKNPTHNVIID